MCETMIQDAAININRIFLVTVHQYFFVSDGFRAKIGLDLRVSFAELAEQMKARTVVLELILSQDLLLRHWKDEEFLEKPTVFARGCAVCLYACRRDG